MRTGRIKSGPAALMQQKTTDSRPCDTCSNYRRCERESLSCTAFNKWVMDGEGTDAPREPNRELYFRIFPGDRKLFNVKKEAA